MPAPQVQGTPTSVTNGTTAGTSFTINKPSGAAVDEYLFAFVRFAVQSTTFSDQQGFTEVVHANAAGANRQYILYKKVTGSEGSSFTFTHTSSAYVAAMVRVSGVHLTTPIDDSDGLAQATTSTTIDSPSLDTTGPVRLLLWMAGTLSDTTVDWTPDLLDTNEIGEFSMTGNSVFSVTREEQAAAGASGTRTATFGASSTGQNTVCCAVIPSDESTPEYLYPNTNTGGQTTNLSTYDYTAIDESPDSPDANWLTGTDPSGTPPNIQRITGADNVGNPTTSTSVTVPTVQVDDIILVSVTNGDGTAQPTISDNSGVGSWTNGTGGGVVKHQAGTAMAGTVFWKRITNAGSETGATVSLSGMTGSTVANIGVWRGCVTSGSPVDVTPVGEGNNSGDNSMAGITTATDGAQVILNVFYSDNTASTTSMATATSPGALTKHTEIYSSGGSDSGLATASEVKATAGATGNFTWAPGTAQISVSIGFALKPFSVAGATTNTEVRAPMADPTQTLATGSTSGKIRALVRKLGNGTNPQCKLEVRNAAGTLLATALANTAVSSTSGVVLSGDFDQTNISNPTDVVVWVVGTGAAGGLVEVGAIEWQAKTSATLTAGQSRVLIYNVTGLARQDRQLLYNVSGRAGQSRQLLYNISGLATQARQLLYNVTGQARQDRQVLYNVSGLATQSRQLLYNISGRAGQSRQILHNISALAGQNRTLLYNIAALAGQQRQLLYDVRALAGQSRQILYDLLQTALTAGASRGILYNVNGIARGDRQVLYDIYTKAAQQRQILYNISTKATQSRTLLYNISALAGQQRQLLYNISGRAGQNRQLLFNVTGQARGDRQILFNISTRAGQSRVLLYNVTGQARGDRQLLFNVNNLSRQDRQLLYNISTKAGAQRSILYNITGLAGQNRELLFNVLTNALIAGASRGILYNVNGLSRQDRQLLYDIYTRATQSRAILYNISGRATQSRQLLFNINNLAGQNRQLLYNISTKAGAQRDILYNISALAGQSRQLLYNLLANALIAGASRSILYNITGLARGDRQVLYNVSTKATQSRQIRYDINNLAGQNRIVRYDLRALSGQQRNILYDVRGLSRGDRQLLYNISGRATQSRQIRYDIRALAAAQRTILHDIRGLTGAERTILYNILSHLITLQYSLDVKLENPYVLDAVLDEPYGLEVVSDKPLSLNLEATR